MNEEKIKRLIDVGGFQGEFLYFTANLDGEFLFSLEHPGHSYGVFIPFYSLEALVSDLEFFCQGKSNWSFLSFSIQSRNIAESRPDYGV